jgi:GTP pyrophosphokinase
MNTHDLIDAGHELPRYSDLQCSPRALTLAIHGHKHQQRSDGKAYISHPVRVVRLLQHYYIYDVDTLDTAICHDLLEDTTVTEDDIEYACGRKVVKNVKMLTGVYYADKDTTKLTTEQKTKLIVSKVESYNTAAALVKMADRLDNLTDAIGVWSTERIDAYAKQANLMLGAMAINQNVCFDDNSKQLRNKLYGVANFLSRK